MAAENTIAILIAAKDEASKVIEGAAAKTKAASADVNNSLGSVGGASANAGNAVATVGLITAAAAVTIGVVAVKAAGDFQSALVRLTTSAGESTSNLKLVGDGILQIAQDTGTSTKQLTDAMYLIESAGLHGADGLTVLKAAAEGAKTENADVGVVADAVSSVLQDYHLKASDAAMVTSKLVTAIGDGKTNFQDFAGSLSSVLPIASAAHVSLSDVTAALASMTVHGMSADQASQDVAHSIEKMQSPTQAMTKYLAQLGISSADLSTSLGTKGITGTLQDVSQAIMNKMGPSGKVLIDAFNQSKSAAEDANTMIAAMPANLQKLATQFQNGQVSAGDFRKEIKALPADQANLLTQFSSLQNSASGFNSLLKSGSPEAKTYAAALYAATGDATTLNTALMLTGDNTTYVNKAVKDVTNATTEANGSVKGWSEVQGTFNLKLAQFDEWVKTSTISLGTGLLPIASAAITAFLGFNNVVGSFVSDHSQKLIAAFGALGAAIATFAIGSLITQMYSFIAAGGIATTAMKALDAALAFANLNPTMLGISALVGVVTLVGIGFANTTSTSNNLSGALDRQRTAQTNLTNAERDAKDAEDALSHAKLDAEAAALRVEHAQNDLTAAIQQYGPNSLEARDATVALKQAQLDLSDAQQSLKDKADAAKDAVNKQADANRAAVAAHNAVAAAANGAADGYYNLAASINQAVAADQKSGVNAGFGGSNTLNAMLGIPHKADGGAVQAGQPYFVGDNPDGSLNKTSELFIPSQSGSIVNASSLQSMLATGPGAPQPASGVQGTATKGGDTYNITISGSMTFANADASTAFWDRIDKTQRLSKVGMA